MSTQTRGPTRVRSGLAILMAGALVGAAAESVYAVEYTFTPVAELGGTYTGIGLGLGSINNDGTVAYVGTSADGIQRVLKTSMDGTTTVIADTTGPLKSFYLSDSMGMTPAINDAGLVGFVASGDAGGTGVYTGNGGDPHLVGYASAFPGRGSRPYLNSVDQVVYHRDTPSSNGFEVVLDTNGSQVTLASTTSQYPYVGAFGINSSGQVLACRGDRGSTNWFLSNGVSEEPIGDGGISSLTRGAISDYHAIFTGATADGREAVYSYRNGLFSVYIDTSGPLKSFREIATNNHGDVIVTAVPDSGNGFIFCGADLSTPVVSIGDSLLGSSITNIMMFPSLNDAGQFVFQAQLADNGTVLVRADAVPEPTSVCLILGALAAAGFGRSSKRPV